MTGNVSLISSKRLGSIKKRFSVTLIRVLDIADTRKGGVIFIIIQIIHQFRYTKIQSKTKRHHLETLGNKLIQILIFIPQSLEMMSFV